MSLETAISDLESQGYFIWDDFLSQVEVDQITTDYQQIYGDGFFKVAGTGNEQGPSNANGKIRSDETYWLDPLALSLSQSIFFDRLKSIKEEINERLFLGLWSLDGHYSRYPVDGHYHRHLDRFNNDDQRTVSMVLYFNQKWVAGDGGELRFHPVSQAVVDVTPISGRLVCFLSSSMLHEVLISHQVRWSFAGWWKRRK